MATQKISEMAAAATPLATTDKIIINRGANNGLATLTNLITLLTAEAYAPVSAGVTDNGDGTIDITFTWSGGSTVTITTPDITGDKGDKGDTGVGTPGSVWYSDVAPPVGFEGVDGDFWLDEVTGIVYKKASGTWSNIFQLSPGPAGADGADGTDGSTILNGNGVPDNGSGNDGDIYVDTANGDLYIKDGGLWGTVVNLKGPTGDTGSPGNDGLGFTGGSYDSGTGVVTFTSDDGLGFATGDLRGEVAGPASSTDNDIVLFNGTTGKIIKDSGVLITAKQDVLTEGAFVDGDKTKLDGIETGATADQTGAEVSLSSVNSAAYTSVQQMQDVYHSSGLVSGGVITDAGSGTVNVTAGEGYIRPTDDRLDTLNAMAFGAATGLSLTDASLNYIYVFYNAGTPTIQASTSVLNTNNYMLLGTVFRDGTTLHITDSTAYFVGDHAVQMINRLQDTAGFARASGGGISETGTRNIAVTAGSWWEGLNNFSTGAKDTSVADTFVYYYQDGVGGWTAVTAQTTIDNLQYDDGSGTLATLANNRYGVHWIYLGVDGDLYVIYGQGSYTLVDAESAGPPSTTPPFFTKHVRLIGRAIVLKSSAALTSIASSFDSAFIPAGASVHNELSGIQGGAVDDYYHLTNAEVTKLDGIEAGATADQTGAEIKALYEAEANTNAYTDAEKTKLADIRRIETNTTINVAASGGDYTTVGAAYDSLDNAYIEAGVTVTISVAAGTFVESQINLDHPQADQITISGAGSGSTTLSFSANAAHGFVATYGTKAGRIKSLTILSTSTTKSALRAYSNAYIRADSDVITNGWGIGVYAQHGSVVFASGLIATDTTTAGFYASDSSFIECSNGQVTQSSVNGQYGVQLVANSSAQALNIVVSGASRSSYCIDVQRGSFVSCYGADLDDGIGGVRCLEASRAHAVTANANSGTGSGFFAQNGSVIHAQGATSTNHTNGFYANDMSHIHANGVTVSGNSTDYSPAIGADGNDNSRITS